MLYRGVLKGAEPRGLPLQEKLISEYLRTLGYRTHIVGKWHLGFYTKEYTPTYRGFESHLGYWTGHHDYYDHTAVEEFLKTSSLQENIMENKNREVLNMHSVQKPCKDGIVVSDSESLKSSALPSTLESPEYDPHKHRNKPHPTTNTETLIHLLKGSLGTGILAMPNAFCNSGYITGTIATILIGILCTYCLHVLVKAQYELCKRLKVPILNYPQSMKIALEQGPQCIRQFAKYSPFIVDGFLIVYQLGICCVYIVFVATNLKQVADQYAEPLDVKIHMLILLVPLIVINYTRNLKLLAPFSSVANIITFVGLGLILSYVFDDLPSIDEREMFGSVRNFSLYFGSTLFALEAVGVIIALENNMKTPQDFRGLFGVLNVGMFIIVLLYIVVGFFGYIKYGTEARGSITLNLPMDTVMAQCIKIMFAIAIFITYALQAYVPVEIIWTTYLDHRIKRRKLLWEYVCRTLITLSTFMFAIAVPRLGLFISLFGALCLSALGIAFPAIIEICTLWPDNFGFFKFQLLKDLGIIVFGCIGLVVGTYVSLIDIIMSFQ